jgi:hypothetical protein
MLTNRKTQLLGMALLIAAATLVTISASRVPAPVDLSWPPRPDFSILNQNVIVPVSGNQTANDFYQRHPEWINHRNELVPVMNAAESADYYQRHPELNEAAGTVTDMSDYSLRHPELFQGTNAIDTSDYFLRH